MSDYLKTLSKEQVEHLMKERFDNLSQQRASLYRQRLEYTKRKYQRRQDYLSS